jgi:2-methylcitrate dehydratase PrpD
VRTFHHATRLAHAHPATTEEAQYSLLFPVAVALKYGAVDFDAIHGDALKDAEVLRLSHLIRTEEQAEFTSRFPGERLAQVSVELVDGRCFDSGTTQALGDPDLPLGATGIRQKFRRFAERACNTRLATELENRVDELGSNDAPIAALLDLVLGEIKV